MKYFNILLVNILQTRNYFASRSVLTSGWQGSKPVRACVLAAFTRCRAALNQSQRFPLFASAASPANGKRFPPPWRRPTQPSSSPGQSVQSLKNVSRRLRPVWSPPSQWRLASSVGANLGQRRFGKEHKSSKITAWGVIFKCLKVWRCSVVQRSHVTASLPCTHEWPEFRLVSLLY